MDSSTITLKELLIRLKDLTVGGMQNSREYEEVTSEYYDVLFSEDTPESEKLEAIEFIKNNMSSFGETAEAFILIIKENL